MKKLFLLVMICTLAWGIQAQDYKHYNTFREVKTGYLLADRVNVRASASTKGELVAQLPIGTSVKLLSWEGELTIKNNKSPWCKIEFKHKGKRQEGYVWGGLLATLEEKKGDEQFLFGMESLKKEEFMNKITGQLRVAKDGKELDKIVFDAIGDEGYYMSFKITDGKGFKNVKKIIQITFNYDVCDYAQGSVYFFWTGEKLINIGTYWDSMKLIYPTDKEGEANTLTTILEHGYFEDNEEGEFIITKTEKKKLKWDGKVLK